MAMSTASGEENAAPSEAPADVDLRRRKRGAILFFVLLLVALPLVAGLVLRLYGPEVEREALRNLDAVARLKGEQLENWLDERSSATAVLHQDETFKTALQPLLAPGAPPFPALRKNLQGRLQALQTQYHLSSITVLDAAYRVVLQQGQDTEAPLSALTRDLLVAAADNTVQRSNLYRGLEDKVQLQWVVPLRAAGSRQVQAYVLMRVDAKDFVYPLIQTWPTASTTGETLLARRQDDQVLFLNEFRHQKDTALRLTKPLDTPDLPAAVALQRGDSGVLEGTDYRQERVLAAYRPVQGTDWVLVAKLDRAEVVAPLYRLTFWVGLITLVSVVSVGIGFALLWTELRRSLHLAHVAHSSQSELEQRRLQDVNRQALARAQMLIDAALDAVVTVDDSGRIVGWNAQAEPVFGRTTEEALGCDMAELIIPAHLREGHRRGMARYLSERQPHILGRRVEVEGLHSDGHSFPIELSIVSMEQDGRTYFSAYIRDLTERKASEQQLYQLSLAMDQSPASVAITDLQGALQWVNEEFVRSTGYSRHEALGRNPRILQSGDTPEATYQAMWGALGQGHSWQGVLYNRRKDGSRYTELARMSPIRNANGVVTHYMATKEDITEKNRLTQELEQHREHLEELVQRRTAELEVARAAAEAANQAKSAFLANMSHEIRTPMNAIVGFAHLLRRANPSPEQVDRLDKIDAAAKHLLSVINDILDLSKIEAGRLVLESTDFHLGSLLDNVYSLLAEQARAKGLALQVDPDSVPLWLRGDPTRLRQALLNYVGNAIKFTAQGSVQLRARVLEDTPQGCMLRFEVQDTGVGIAPAQQERLFQAFEQADTSTTRQYGGTGLGLAITAKIARLMGGQAGVHSAPGEGSTFWFTAWLGHGQGPMPLQQGEDAESAELQLRRYHGAHILLADDVDINREIAQQMLLDSGVLLDLADNGQTALERVRDTAYDLVLMDLQMPVMDGLAATRAIHALPGRETLPVIAMTANVFDEDRRACLDAGMVDFVFKPIEPEHFYRTLIKWLPERHRGLTRLHVPLPRSGGALRPAPMTTDFPGIDVAAGLATWRQQPVYARFLHKFLLDHAGAPAQLAQLQAGGERQAVAALAHKIKGAAGNLALVDVAHWARRVDEGIRAGQDIGEALAQLQQALDTATASVQRYAPCEPAAKMVVALDEVQRARALALVQTLLAALDADNPDQAEPLLLQLEGLVPSAALAEVRATLTDFDFRGAEAATRLLAQQWGGTL